MPNAWLTPNKIPYGVRRRALTIPNDSVWDSLLLGALLLLADESNFEQYGALTPEEVAEVFTDALFETVSAPGCCEVSYSQRIIGLSNLCKAYYRLADPSGFNAYDEITASYNCIASGGAWGNVGIQDGGTAWWQSSGTCQLVPWALYNYLSPNLFTAMLWFRMLDDSQWTDGLQHTLFVFYAAGLTLRLYKSATDDEIILSRIAGAQGLKVSAVLDRRSNWWIPIAVVADRANNRLELWIDGVLVDSDSTAQNNWTNPTFTTVVGNYGAVSSQFYGGFANVGFWATALSAAEILKHHVVT